MPTVEIRRETAISLCHTNANATVRQAQLCCALQQRNVLKSMLPDREFNTLLPLRSAVDRFACSAYLASIFHAKTEHR